MKPLTRRRLFALLAAFAGRLFAQPKPNALPLLIDVGPGKNVTITFRGYDNASLTGVVVDVLMSSEDAAARARLTHVLGTATGLTVILTTSRDRITPAPK
jgi:hypothetical protein